MAQHAEDNDAIRRCQRGDISGLEMLIARYQVAATRLAYLLTGDRPLAEDLVQESFLKAYHAIGKFRPEQPFASWLHRIVTNAARQHYQSAQMRHEVSLNHVPARRPPLRRIPRRDPRDLAACLKTCR